MRVLRNSTLVAQAGSVSSNIAPSFGWEVANVFMRLPGASGGTLVIQQKIRNSTTWITTDTFTLAAAGVISDVAIITAEHIRAVFTEGGTVGGQIADILVWMS